MARTYLSLHDVSGLKKKLDEHTTALKLLQYHLGLFDDKKKLVKMLSDLEIDNFGVMKYINKYKPCKCKCKCKNGYKKDRQKNNRSS